MACDWSVHHGGGGSSRGFSLGGGNSGSRGGSSRSDSLGFDRRDSGLLIGTPIDQLLLTCKSIHDQHPDDAIVLYLFSDGEQTSSKARRTFSSLRRYLSDAFTVAIGSEQGGNIPVIADGVDGNADQWVTDPDTGKPGVSRMNKDEMASIADELSGTALVLNASNTMRDGVSKEASDKWRVTQTTKKRTRTMPVV